MINVIVNPSDGIFAALASLPRRQMLAFLSQTALTTAELAGRFGMSPPAVSRHLSVLQQAGLVSRERQGQRVLYRLDRDMLLNALSRLAAEVDGPLRTSPREAI
jgi:DNA-binding transcriptional ArsR family regulator